MLLSVNVTFIGAYPERGDAENLAIGTMLFVGAAIAVADNKIRLTRIRETSLFKFM
jgi:hypothetical protein